MIVVPFVGPVPSEVMIVGERPGYDEAHWQVNGRPAPTPFVGPSGAEQDSYLVMNGMHRRRIRIGNLVQDWDGGRNPDDADIARWEGRLEQEIAACRPKWVLSVGAHSTRWFLGGVDMESVHGLPQRSKRSGHDGFTVIPLYHPAYGLRDPDAKVLVWWDYRQAARIIRGEFPAKPAEDGYPEPHYIDGGIKEMGRVLRCNPREIAEDTEGLRGREWGFSISIEPGVGYVFRRAHPDYSEVARAYQDFRCRHRPITVMHNSMWDLEIERNLELGSPAAIFDTMVAAFFLRVEPQGLKALARRWCGMEMRTYEETIGEAATGKHYDWLQSALAHNWGKPEPRLVYENDGTARVYSPQGANRRIEKILADWGNDPAGTDLEARWKAVDEEIRQSVESRMGRFPQATLDDIEKDEAIRYAGRDPDATLRVKAALEPQIAAAALTDRLQLDLDIIPIFEEMQASGIPASRKYFESLSSEMWDRMMEIGQYISYHYNDGQPFNPMSAPQVGELAKRRGLKGAKRTKTGMISTSKKSMEHLRKLDDAMDKVFLWREHEKVKDSFADPITASMPDGVDFAPVRCNIKITRVAQDRISASDPNLTAMPVATDLGRRVRDGFRLPDDSDEVFVTGDMSQIEMRVMADLSGDEFMCRLFREGRDIHKETASKIFGIPLESVDKMIHRNPTKRAGFGVITGIQGPGLYDQLRVMGVDIDRFCATMGNSDPVKACNLLIREWFRVYPRCQQFLTQCGARAYRDGYVRELGGFIRYLPSVWSKDEYVAAEARRQSHSHIISGTAQWMLRRSMRWLAPQVAALREESGLEVRWLMQIHDEVLFLCHKDIAEAMAMLIQEALTKHAGELRIPVEAGTAIAKTWGSLEK